MEAERAIATGELDSFLAVLEDLGRPQAMPDVGRPVRPQPGRSPCSRRRGVSRSRASWSQVARELLHLVGHAVVASLTREFGHGREVAEAASPAGDPRSTLPWAHRDIGWADRARR
jgi:hypothetical protein